uniref:Uncharacterized protein n=1 Tax=Glossina austeni TaxID=7395 RepID=A0A1A9V5J5_GLOAU
MKILFTKGSVRRERQTEVQRCIFHILKLKKANYSHISIFKSKELKIGGSKKIQNAWHQTLKEDFTLGPETLTSWSFGEAKGSKTMVLFPSGYPLIICFLVILAVVICLSHQLRLNICRQHENKGFQFHAIQTKELASSKEIRTLSDRHLKDLKNT